jgi:hypothetical protein
MIIWEHKKLFQINILKDLLSTKGSKGVCGEQKGFSSILFFKSRGGGGGGGGFFF